MSAALFDINGKVACVTGASSGLGRAAANMLAAAGVKVVGVKVGEVSVSMFV